MARAEEKILKLLGTLAPNIEEKEEAVKIASALLRAMHQERSRKEKGKEKWLARMVQDPTGKEFMTQMTDQCFRSQNVERTSSQICFLIEKYGIPTFLPFGEQALFFLFRSFNRFFPSNFLKEIKEHLKKEMAQVLFTDEQKLHSFIKLCQKQHCQVILNHLGEAVLGEKEADARCKLYHQKLLDPNICHLSIKISNLYSQISMVAWHHSLETLKQKLAPIYEQAVKQEKVITLDMEEYKDLELTCTLFQELLSERRFLHLKAGIVLQSYLPEAATWQQKLTLWAQERHQNGGAPIHIRLVKGANLSMERVEASLRGWQTATFETKLETDANYKNMVAYGLSADHSQAVTTCIASHNLFDVAYALILAKKNGVQRQVHFELLAGMAEPMRRTLAKIVPYTHLYCPQTSDRDFHHALSYLIRRLDENTGENNFLRDLFYLKPNSDAFKKQEENFFASLDKAPTLSTTKRRKQNRTLAIDAPFCNEEDTDFTLPENRQWLYQHLEQWKGEKKELPLHNRKRVEQAVATAKDFQSDWQQIERTTLLVNAAQEFRKERGNLIGAMVAFGNKNVEEADVEISEAIDFIEYYLRNWKKLRALTEFKFEAKGTVLITPPWNFPCSISVGTIAASLTTGNCVLYKSPPETTAISALVAEIFHKAGIPQKALQLILCKDDPEGSFLIQHPDIDTVLLTGATESARAFLKMRPTLDLYAETGGKNSMIITAMCDRDLAIKDLISSAFGHAGQKCSAASIAILEKELYEDPNFLEQLVDATESLHCGSAWDLQTKIPPLIRPPQEALKRALTTLEPEESWLLKPKELPGNLWSPGIKLGVSEGSYTHQTEFFGPLLAVMCAENLKEAISIANKTPYGLTSGLHSLDEREQKVWKEQIVAGNLYINRTTTGAVVRRQPFGGCKASSFGLGAKAGGPNYLLQLVTPTEIFPPQEHENLPASLAPLISCLKPLGLDDAEVTTWKVSAQSYVHWNKIFKDPQDPSCLLGQDNLHYHVAKERIYLRLTDKTLPLDFTRIIAAAMIVGTPLEISASRMVALPKLKGVSLVQEEESNFVKRVDREQNSEVRLIGGEGPCLGGVGIAPFKGPVYASGRLELLNYLREVSLSHTTHRYGYLPCNEG